MTRLRIGTINVPTKVGPNNWETCFRRMATRADIFGINEVGSKHAKALYNRVKDDEGFSQFGLFRGTNPVFWNVGKYRLVHGRSHRIHGAARGRLARRFPGFNAERTLTEVVLAQRAGGPEIAVLYTHWVAPGWKVNPIWRRRMRARSKSLLRELVREHWAAGRIVVPMGDFNLRLPFWVIRGFRWLRGRGVDKVGILAPAGIAVTADVDVFPAPTDHKHGVAVDVDLTRKATR